MPDDALSTWLREGTAPSEEGDGAPPAWRDNPFDGGFSWPGDSGDERPQRRAWRLLALAVAPWLVVGALVIGGWRPSHTESTSHSPSVAPHQPHSTERPATLTNRTEPDSEMLDPALGATAAAAVQQALTGTDPATGRSRYVSLVLPEAATWVGDVTIVDVAAVVLEGADGNWDHPRTARYAIPLQARAGAVRVLNGPWALPDPPQTTPGGTAFTPVNDEALTEAAGHALNSVGYRDVQVQELARDEALPGVLKVKAMAISPGEGQPRSQEIWISDHPSPTVLGAVDLEGHGEQGEPPRRSPDAATQPPVTIQGGAQ